VIGDPPHRDNQPHHRNRCCNQHCTVTLTAAG
jgi:hypothetical protein